MPNPAGSTCACCAALPGQSSGRASARRAEANSARPLSTKRFRPNIDRDALESSGARMVIVNLDADSDAHIDHVYDVLDEGDYQVVFNDANVSSNLSGWDHARWARNLAAKILSRPEIVDAAASARRRVRADAGTEVCVVCADRGKARRAGAYRADGARGGRTGPAPFRSADHGVAGRRAHSARAGAAISATSFARTPFSSPSQSPSHWSPPHRSLSRKRTAWISPP